MDESRILVDYDVTNYYNKGFDRTLDDITECVIHHTAGDGNWKGLKTWMLQGGPVGNGKSNEANYKRGIALFHFCIEKSGQIVKLGPISKWWYHSCSGNHDKYTVGIEIIHKSGEFTDAQYESLYWILCDYLPYHCRNFEHIVGHDYNFKKFSNMTKGCPSEFFKWELLEKEFEKRNIKYLKIADMSYEIIR